MVDIYIAIIGLAILFMIGFGSLFYSLKNIKPNKKSNQSYPNGGE